MGPRGTPFIARLIFLFDGAAAKRSSRFGSRCSIKKQNLSAIDFETKHRTATQSCICPKVKGFYEIFIEVNSPYKEIGHCKSCIDVIEAENQYQIKGILDIKEKLGQSLLGYKIM